MGYGKTRPIAHIKGEQGVKILKEVFPDSWVVREYSPDYAIDLNIEIFEEHGDHTPFVRTHTVRPNSFAASMIVSKSGLTVTSPPVKVTTLPPIIEKSFRRFTISDVVNSLAVFSPAYM